MKRALAIVAVAAALTLWWSPSLRNAGLRLLFYRDFPETPYGFEPKHHTYLNGERIS